MKNLINSVKSVLPFFTASLLYIIGLLSYNIMSDMSISSIWFWITNIITVFILGVPAMKYWESKVENAINSDKK